MTNNSAAESPLFPSSLFDKTTWWFDRANASLLGNLPCCQGCSHCCLGLFPITILDRQEIQRGLLTLPDERRKRMQDTASAQVSTLMDAASQLTSTPFIDQWREEEIDQLTRQFDTWPCPALELDGACGLYEFRPLVCRSMGIPPEEAGSVSGACAVQTAIPLIRVPSVLREEENQLAGIEAHVLATLRPQLGTQGEELFLPFAFLPDQPMGSINQPA